MAETVTLPQSETRPSAPPAAPPSPPPEPAPEVLEAKRKEWLKSEFGIEDAGEIKRWKAAADELPQARQALEHVLRRPPPLPSPPGTPQEQPLDLEKLREYGRIDPVGAMLTYEQYRERQRLTERTMEQQRTAQMIGAAQQYERETADAQAYLKAELPEVYDQKSDLQREAVAIYNSSPYYQQTGQGMRLAAEIAAARLGVLPKSKRQAPAPTRDVADQEPERGTRRPARSGETPNEQPLTPEQKKLAKSMGLDEKAYRVAIKARRDGKNIKVE